MFKSLIASVVIGCTGCASIIHGTTQDVTVYVEPLGSCVSIDGNTLTCRESVAHVSLSRDNQHHVKAWKKGCQDYSQYITYSVSGVLAANLLFIFPFLWGTGMTIDMLSGAAYSLDLQETNGYERINVILRCE
jgi:hypothetical protein